MDFRQPTSDDPDDGEESDFIRGIGVANYQTSGGISTGWPHMGHWVWPRSEEADMEIGDTYGEAWCETCNEMGEYYVIDGTAYIDVAHGDPVGSSSVTVVTKETIADVVAKSAEESAAILLPAKNERPRKRNRKARNRVQVQIQA